MQQILYPANERGLKDIGWLQSRFSFSFSSYQHPGKKSFGLLHTLNDDIVQPGGGFGLHPHVNMEIISVLLQGTMNHKDSMGYSDVVSEDWVQIMSAGSGIAHSEKNANSHQPVKFLQIWVFPKAQNIAPRYDQKSFPANQRINQITTVVAPDNEQAVWINQNAWFSLANLTKDFTTEYAVKLPQNGVYAFVIKGAVTINGIQLAERDGLGISEAEHLQITAIDDTELLLIDVPMHQN